jgi:hypothetical protein
LRRLVLVIFDGVLVSYGQDGRHRHDMVEIVITPVGLAYFWETMLVNGVHLSLVLVFEFVVTVFDEAGIL